MKQTIKGWTLAVTSKERVNAPSFLGRYYKTSAGKYFASTYTTPYTPEVIGSLFKTAEDALAFWKELNCDLYGGKDAYNAMPVEIEWSFECKGLGVEWKPIKPIEG